MKCNISDRSPVPQTVDHHDSQVFAASSRVQVQVIVMKKSDAISKQMIFFLFDIKRTSSLLLKTN